MEQEFTEQDSRENQRIAAIGYVAFFVPLILCNQSRIGRHCANQGLLLTVAIAIISILAGILASIPLIGWVFRILGGIVSLFLFLIGLLCCIQLETNKKVTTLPYIGHFRLIS